MSTGDRTGPLAMLRARDPLAAARANGTNDMPIVVRRGPAPDGWFTDGDEEGAIGEHRAAHLAGRPSEATVRYGNGVDEDAVAERLQALAALASETGLLRAVVPLPAEGGEHRPGSWGVEDLTVVAACRAALPESVHVRPSWRHLGPAACQIAVAFGATAWAVPEDDRTDIANLAAGVGRTFVDEEAG